MISFCNNVVFVSANSHFASLQVAVYHTLSFVDLSPVECFNETMRQIQARRAGTIALNRARREKAQKVSQQPTLYKLYKNVLNKPAPQKRFGYMGRIKKVADKYQGKAGEVLVKKKSVAEEVVPPNVIITKDDNSVDGDGDNDIHGGLMDRTESNMSQVPSQSNLLHLK